MNKGSYREAKLMRVTTFLTALLLLVSFNAAQGEEDKRPGTISGTVTNAKGEIVVGFPIKLYEFNFNPGADFNGGRSEKAPKRNAWGLPDVIQMQSKFGPLVGTVMTDKKGQYLFKNLKPGSFRYRAGGVETFRTVGTAGGTCNLQPGTNMILDIQLMPPQH
jgi:hypothetical protein